MQNRKMDIVLSSSIDNGLRRTLLRTLSKSLLLHPLNIQTPQLRSLKLHVGLARAELKRDA